MDKWPNFFIVGAPRAGTSSMFSYLKNIRGIYMPKIKEPNYFSTSTDSKFFYTPIRDKKKYLELFKDAKNEIIGEASPSYLRDPKSPKLIHEIVPEAKIIIILRDPVERTYSHYVMFKEWGIINTSLSDLIKKIPYSKNEYEKRIFESSMYYEQVKNYFDTFGPENVKIIIFKDFIEDTNRVLQEVLKFLNVKFELFSDIEKIRGGISRPRLFLGLLIKNELFRNFGKRIPPRLFKPLIPIFLKKQEVKPKMLEEDRKFLESYYYEDVKKLQKILNYDFPWFWVRDYEKNSNFNTKTS